MGWMGCTLPVWSAPLVLPHLPASPSSLQATATMIKSTVAPPLLH